MISQVQYKKKHDSIGRNFVDLRQHGFPRRPAFWGWIGWYRSGMTSLIPVRFMTSCVYCSLYWKCVYMFMFVYINICLDTNQLHIQVWNNPIAPVSPTKFVNILEIYFRIWSVVHSALPSPPAIYSAKVSTVQNNVLAKTSYLREHVFRLSFPNWSTLPASAGLTWWWADGDAEGFPAVAMVQVFSCQLRACMSILRGGQRCLARNAL